MEDNTLDFFFQTAPYSLEKEDKQAHMFKALSALNTHHYDNSAAFHKYQDVVFPTNNGFESIDALPFLPVTIFKTHYLKSVADENVYKVLTSSGTTGSVPSKIVLDTETAKLQTRALSKIIGFIMGTQRLPMLIIDSKSVLSNRQTFSARGAGILGLSVFGRDHTYILDDDFKIDETLLDAFLEKYNGKEVFIFGFTFMVWQYLFEQLKHRKDIDLSKATLIHSGGWKKLQDKAVDNSVFRKELKEAFGLEKIYNFYGMVEQVGSVFLENSDGYLHCPIFSDIIIRNPKDFSVQPHGTEGLIQVISVLPKSYPGHSILTEDIGVCMGEDDNAEGWKGKYFKILGRAKKAELRGCSDTFASKFS